MAGLSLVTQQLAANLSGEFRRHYPRNSPRFTTGLPQSSLQISQQISRVFEPDGQTEQRRL